MLHLNLSCVLLIVTAALPSAAFAAPPPSPGAPASPTMADDLRRGDAARRAGRWTDAAAAYRSALERAEREGAPKEERAAILGEIGLCELKLGKHRDAAELLFQGLLHRNALAPDQRARFESGIEIAEARLGAFVITTEPADAEVVVTGKSYGPQEAITAGAIGLVAAGSFLVAANESSPRKRLQLVPIVDGERAAVVLRGVW